ncbi:MAG: translocation/assembly module TamB domain-containing protein [Alphaproteobacteria bacterium]|nr:MAG: translocation/assembly module TamB domain-containing protein [Alphaproteobacteria bacterium]
MFRRLFLVFLFFQLPPIQNSIIKSANFLTAPLGYTYSFNQVSGLFPFFIKIDHFVVYEGKKQFLTGRNFYLNWRRVAADYLWIRQTNPDAYTDYYAVYNGLKKLTFFRRIDLHCLQYENHFFALQSINKSGFKKAHLVYRDNNNSENDFEARLKVKETDGFIQFKTLNSMHVSKIHHDAKQFHIFFQDFIFTSDKEMKKHRLFYKNQAVNTEFFGNVLSIKHTDFNAKIDLYKRDGVFQYKTEAPIKAQLSLKGDQLILFSKTDVFLRYDMVQNVGFIRYENNTALYKDGVFKNIQIHLKDFQNLHNIKADGFLSVSAIPYFNIKAQIFNKYPVEIDLTPRNIFARTKYFESTFEWNFSEVYLTHFKGQKAVLKRKTLLYPIVSNLELVSGAKKVLVLKNFDYEDFEKLYMDWKIFLPFVHCHAKADISKKQTKDKSYYSGAVQLKRIKSFYLDKMMDIYFSVNKEALDIKATMACRDFMKGGFNLDTRKGYAIFHTQSQDISIPGNEILGNVEGRVDIMQDDDWRLNGSVFVSNGRFENSDYGVVLNNVKTDIHFDNELIKYTFSADQCKSSGYYNIKTGKSFYRLNLDQYNATQTDDLALKLTGELEGTLNPLYAKGQIYIDEGFLVIREPPYEQSFDLMKVETQSTSVTFPFACDIDVAIREKVGMDAFDLKADWEGKVSVHVHNEILEIVGALKARKGGDIKILGTPMVLKHGSLVFEKEDALNPKLDLLFETEMEGKTLNVQVKGEVQSLDMPIFFSTPSMSPEDVMSYILFGAPTQKLSITDAIRLTFYLTKFKMFTPKSGLDILMEYVDLKKVDEEDDSGTQVISIGKRFGDLKFALERRLRGLEIQDMKVLLGYNLTKSMALEVSISEFEERDRMNELGAMLRYKQSWE